MTIDTNRSFERTENLIGKEAVRVLKQSRAAVFGIGGVGSYVVEALARSGIGSLDLIDSDTVDITNINRQLIATVDTVGQDKVEVAKHRVLNINPDCRVRAIKLRYLPEHSERFDFEEYDYVVDAVDNVTAKLSLVEQTYFAGIPIISAMGAGNKLDPTAFEVADIFETSVCPLARVMRHELKKRKIDHLKVVYSKEEPVKVSNDERIPASIAFVPSVMGLIIASEVIKDIIKRNMD